MIKLGDKVKGFQFDDSSGVRWVPSMEKLIGETGTVLNIHNDNSFDIYFGDSKKPKLLDTWTYPTKEYLAILREEKLKEIGIC